VTRYDLPLLLRECLNSASRRNPRFSLRAFAKQLGMDHSTLSQILKNQRRLSVRNLETVSKRLGLSEEVVRSYAQRHHRQSRVNPGAKDVRSVQLDLDTFLLLSLWHHCAILELTHIRGFKADSRWIAKTLGISLADVNIALQRMLRLGLLQMLGPNHWSDTSRDAEFHSAALTDTASNQVEQAVHELAIQAVKQTPNENRVHRQMIISFTTSQLAQLAQLADGLMEQIRSLGRESEPKDDVFQVEVSIFPLTTIKQSTRSSNA
jgi:uncharacterized protein (TIGR02147 family)